MYPKPPIATATSTREVLVVDDMPEICDFLAALLGRARSLDVRVRTEINGARALDLVRTRPFDLVISDFRMREVDGIELLTAARLTHPQGLRVLMTGYNEIPATNDRIRQAKVDAYLQKPLRSQDLLLLVLELMTGNVDILASCRSQAREMETVGTQVGPEAVL
ncbi:MAG TPA: response regulator [Candidatus Thermoplasmatota archaeon]|nr:response regulator [Candidatus Thermoplasmatota archaeon]